MFQTSEEMVKVILLPIELFKLLKVKQISPEIAHSNS